MGSPRPSRFGLPSLLRETARTNTTGHGATWRTSPARSRGTDVVRLYSLRVPHPAQRTRGMLKDRSALP